MDKLDAAIIPGNGCDSGIDHCMWYGWVKKRLCEAGLETKLQVMPDPCGLSLPATHVLTAADVARESIWIPFMQSTLKCGENTVIIGHSSGAEAAMRYAETHKVLGVVLVAPCVTDMGIENERASGYYSRPWDWAAMGRNTKWFIQFTSQDDPFVDYAEQQEVKAGLEAGCGDYTYNEFTDRGHFQSSTFPQLVQAIVAKLSSPK